MRKGGGTLIEWSNNSASVIELLTKNFSTNDEGSWRVYHGLPLNSPTNLNSNNNEILSEEVITNNLTRKSFQFTSRNED